MEGDNNNIFDMKLYIGKLLDNVLKQGFSITLLVLYVAWSQYQNNQLGIAIDECNKAQVEYFKQDRVDFLTIMADVKVALRENTKVMRKIADE